MISRRRFLLLPTLVAAAASGLLPVPGRAQGKFGADVSVRGQLRPLSFTMTLSSSGRKITAADFRGDVVLLYFGFTRCPDTCALTTYNAARLLPLLGSDAARVRYLFVTIDLAHDTLPILRRYLAEFGAPPEINGLHGTPSELEALAKRYFIYYKAPSSPDAPDPVSGISHASGVYLFGPDGQALDLVSDLGGADAALPPLAQRIRLVLAEANHRNGFLGGLERRLGSLFGSR